jgi:hypothetical protein
MSATCVLSRWQTEALWLSQLDRVEIVTEHDADRRAPSTLAAYAEWTWQPVPGIIHTRWVTTPDLAEAARADLADFDIDAAPCDTLTLAEWREGQR